MPMTAGSATTTGLSAEIKAKVQSKNPEFSTNIADSMDWLFDSIAEAVIEHIVANQVVVTAVVNTAVGASPAETYLSGTGTSTSIS